MNRIHLPVLAAIASFSLTVFAAETTDVTPYRPTVSNPAQLPAAGQLEQELGGMKSQPGAQADDRRRGSLPYLLKFGFSQEWGVLLGGDAYVSTDDAGGGRAHGLGDTTVLAKRAFLIDDANALGVEFGAKLPTARDAIGSGKTDYLVNGIYSRDFGKLQLDANVNFTRMGAVEADAARMQTGYSAAFSMPLSEKWGATAELSGPRRGGTPRTAQRLAALTSRPPSRLPRDPGLLYGFNTPPPAWPLSAAIVVPPNSALPGEALF